MNRLFSHGRAQSDSLIYPGVHHELFAGHLPRSSFPRRVVLRSHQHFKHTTPLAHSSAMIRFILLNLSVSESMTPLELRLPLFNYESYTLS
jgi:hypothetical protein